MDKVILYDSKNNPLSVVRARRLFISSLHAHPSDLSFHSKLQRIGRTGRKREGSVIVLSSEGREEQNWDKAQDKYAAGAPSCLILRVFFLVDDLWLMKRE